MRSSLRRSVGDSQGGVRLGGFVGSGHDALALPGRCSRRCGRQLRRPCCARHKASASTIASACACILRPPAIERVARPVCSIPLRHHALRMVRPSDFSRRSFCSLVLDPAKTGLDCKLLLKHSVSSRILTGTREGCGVGGRARRAGHRQRRPQNTARGLARPEHRKGYRPRSRMRAGLEGPHRRRRRTGRW